MKKEPAICDRSSDRSSDGERVDEEDTDRATLIGSSTVLEARWTSSNRYRAAFDLREKREDLKIIEYWV